MTGQTPTTNEDDGETNAIATLDDRRRYDTIRHDTSSYALSRIERERTFKEERHVVRKCNRMERGW